MNMTMDAPVPELRRTRRICAAAAFASLGSLWAALLVAAPEDVASQAALQGYLDRAGGRMFVAWILVVLSGSAWLCLVVGLRRMLPAGAGRDLFVVAAVSGQAAAWVGASLATAAAGPNARDLPLSVFNAFAQGAHLASAAGVAATGVSLLGFTAAGRSAQALVPRWFGTGTACAGVLLIPAAVVGPISILVQSA
jgi:hypothetical protein